MRHYILFLKKKMGGGGTGKLSWSKYGHKTKIPSECHWQSGTKQIHFLPVPLPPGHQLIVAWMCFSQYLCLAVVTINLISVSLCLHLILSTVLAPGLRMHSGYKALTLSTPFKIMYTSIRSLNHFSLDLAIILISADQQVNVFSRPFYLLLPLHKIAHYKPICSWK